jgi:hypothetical protein
MTRHGLTGSKLHDLSHFRASALISTGADIAAVSKEMGHSTISVTSDLYGQPLRPCWPGSGRARRGHCALATTGVVTMIPSKSPTFGRINGNGPDRMISAEAGDLLELLRARRDSNPNLLIRSESRTQLRTDFCSSDGLSKSV